MPENQVFTVGVNCKIIEPGYFLICGICKYATLDSLLSCSRAGNLFQLNLVWKFSTHSFLDRRSTYSLISKRRENNWHLKPQYKNVLLKFHKKQMSKLKSILSGGLV